MLVYAKSTASVGWEGGRVRLTAGDVWDGNDPFVRANPSMFTDTPLKVHRTAAPVEQASAAPGEKRAVKK